MRRSVLVSLVLGALCVGGCSSCNKEESSGPAPMPIATAVPAYCVAQSRSGDVLACGAETDAPGPMGLGIVVTSGVYALPADGGPPKRLHDGLPHQDVRAIVTTPSGAWLIAAGSLYRSDDQGAHWSEVEGAPGGVLSLLVARSETILAGTGGQGIYFSKDDGKTWKHSYHRDTVVHDLAQHPNGWLFAATSKGVRASNDDGEAWEYMGLEKAHPRAVLVTKAGDVLAGVAATDIVTRGAGPGGFILGDMMEAAGTKAGAFRCKSADCAPVKPDAGAPGAKAKVKTKPRKPPIEQDGGTEAGSSSDPESAWEELGPRRTTIQHMVELPDGGVLAATLSSGVMRLDRSAWSRSSTGMPDDMNVLGLLVAKDKSVYAATAIGLFRSKDNGENWQKVSLLPPAPEPKD